MFDKYFKAVKEETKKVEVFEFNGKLYRNEWEVTRDKLGDSLNRKRVKTLTPIVHDACFPFSVNTRSAQVLAEWIIDNKSLIDYIMEEKNL